MDIRYIMRNGKKVLQKLMPSDINEITDPVTGKRYVEFSFDGSRWVDVEVKDELLR